MAYIVMAYIVMAYIVMAYIVMAYIVMAYIVMAFADAAWELERLRHVLLSDASFMIDRQSSFYGQRISWTRKRKLL